jgi:biopolymer transport protein ExbB
MCGCHLGNPGLYSNSIAPTPLRVCRTEEIMLINLVARRFNWRITGLLVLWLALVWLPAGWAQDAGEAAAPQVKTATAWDMIKHGGPSLVLLVICSIATVTLIIERFMFYRKAAGDSAALIEKITQAGSYSEALTALEGQKGIAAQVYREALTAARDGYKSEQIEQLVQGSVTKQLIAMEKFLPQLDTFVTMCPLIGLAGTTLGMIKSFSIVAAIGMSDPTKLAGGISEALVNTAAGLLVAIPALFAYNWFTGQKEAILMNMESGLSELMVLIKASEAE